jgi:hypothetical protein
MVWSTPSNLGGGMEFRTYSCPSMSGYDSWQMWVYPSSGTWTFQLRPHSCSFSTICPGDYTTYSGVAGNQWKLLTLRAHSACLDGNAGLSGFEISYSWTGASGKKTLKTAKKTTSSSEKKKYPTDVFCSSGTPQVNIAYARLVPTTCNAVTTTQAATTPAATTTRAATTQPATTSSGGASSCSGLNIYSNSLNTNWVNFVWGAALTRDVVAPAGAPAGITKAIQLVESSQWGGGLVFRTYTCVATGAYRAYRMFVYGTSGTWSFTVKPTSCNTAAGNPTVCSSVTKSVTGGSWQVIELPIHSACLDALAGSSGFQIDHSISGATTGKRKRSEKRRERKKEREKRGERRGEEETG